MPAEFSQKHRNKIDNLLAGGHPRKAYQYLMGVMGSVPYDEQMYVYLGRTVLAMGEPDRAGLYWALTTDTSPDAARSIEAAQQLYKENMVIYLHVHVRPDYLPTDVQERLKLVLKQAGNRDVDSIFKSNYFPRSKVRFTSPPINKFNDRACCIGCAVLITFVLFFMMFGLMTFISMVFNE